MDHSVSLIVCAPRRVSQTLLKPMKSKLVDKIKLKIIEKVEEPIENNLFRGLNIKYPN